MQGRLRVRVRDRAEVVGLRPERDLRAVRRHLRDRGVIVARRAVGARRAADERRGAGDAVTHDHVADRVRVLGGHVLRFGVERDVAPVGGDRRVEAGALRAADRGISERARHELGRVRAHHADEHVGVQVAVGVHVRQVLGARGERDDVAVGRHPGHTRARRVRGRAAGAGRPADQHVRPGLQVAAVDEPLGLRRRDQVVGERVPRHVAAVGRDDRVERIGVARGAARTLADQRRRPRLRVAEVDLIVRVRLRQRRVAGGEDRALPVLREADGVDARRVRAVGRLADEHGLPRIER